MVLPGGIVGDGAGVTVGDGFGVAVGVGAIELAGETDGLGVAEGEGDGATVALGATDDDGTGVSCTIGCVNVVLPYWDHAGPEGGLDPP